MRQWKQKHYEIEEEAGYAPANPFSHVAATLLAGIAVILFVTGIIGAWGISQSPRPDPVYEGMFEGSLLAEGVDFVVIIVLLVAERRPKR